MPSARTLDGFINEAVEVHGNVYDYSLVSYQRQMDKVQIICKIHGLFEQSPYSHLRGDGCRQCGQLRRSIANRMTRDSFVERAKSVHGTCFTYDRVAYVNMRTAVIITCPTHGDYTQIAADHIYTRAGCPKCKAENLAGRYSQYYFDANPSKRTLPAMIYLIKLTDELPFLKLGITCQSLVKQLSTYPHASVELVHHVSAPLYDAWLCEQHILRKMRDTQHFPLTKFAGSTECLSYTDNSRRMIIEEINNRLDPAWRAK